jgi:hypothetical protein
MDPFLVPGNGHFCVWGKVNGAEDNANHLVTIDVVQTAGTGGIGVQPFGPETNPALGANGSTESRWFFRLESVGGVTLDPDARFSITVRVVDTMNGSMQVGTEDSRVYLKMDQSKSGV